MRSVQDLMDRLDAAKAAVVDADRALEDALELRRSAPVRYVAELLLASQKSNGSGYEYMDEPDVFFPRADKLLELVKGDVDMAESLIEEGFN